MSTTSWDRFIESTRADWNNVGMAVAIVRGTQTVYARGFGVRQYGREEQVDVDTLFQIGSTGKAFATATLGVLVDEGKLGWDDAVIERLPGFQLQDPRVARHLTIRDTVTHRSGLSHNVYPFMALMDADEAVRQLRYLTPQGEFRNSFVYSNLMYALAGQVVQAVSGMTWQEFVKCRLLQPLGMSRSSASPYEYWDRQYVAPTFLGTAPAGSPSLHDARDANLAMPHAWDENGTLAVLPWQSYDNAAAAGALIVSAADMARWLVLNVNEGRFAGQQILEPATLREMHTTQNVHSGPVPTPFATATSSYAMGWWRTQYRGHALLLHGGGIIGSPAYVVLLPAEEIGIAVLSNNAHVGGTAFHRGIALGLLDRVLDAPARDWSRELLADARRDRQDGRKAEDDSSRSRLPHAPPSLPLDRYVGEYEDTGNPSGRMSVRLEDAELVLRFAGSGAYSARLQHWHQDVFRLRSAAGIDAVLGTKFATFAIDPTGRVGSIGVFDTSASRVPDGTGPG